MTHFLALLNVVAATSTKKSSSVLPLVILVVIAVGGYFLALDLAAGGLDGHCLIWKQRGHCPYTLHEPPSSKRISAEKFLQIPAADLSQTVPKTPLATLIDQPRHGHDVP